MAATLEQLESEFSDADPKLRALINLLISENAASRKSILELQRDLQDARALADRDPLCPVLNRRAFRRELKREIAIAQRHERPLSLLFIDLDKFKQINDSQGHEAGDRILVAMANTLRDSVRKTDIVSRLGGDEFGIILVETNAESAAACAEALADRITGAAIGITASIGAATLTRGQTADELMAKADRDMFAHKSRVSLPS